MNNLELDSTFDTAVVPKKVAAKEGAFCVVSTHVLTQ